MQLSPLCPASGPNIALWFTCSTSEQTVSGQCESWKALSSAEAGASSKSAVKHTPHLHAKLLQGPGNLAAGVSLADADLC